LSSQLLLVSFLIVSTRCIKYIFVVFKILICSIRTTLITSQALQIILEDVSVVRRQENKKIPEEPKSIELKEINQLLAENQLMEALKALNYPSQDFDDDKRIIEFKKIYRNNVILTLIWNSEARSLH
jgi:hypothetical protein